MIAITINGEVRELDERRNLDELVAELGFADRRIAIEMDGEVVPRSKWVDTPIRDGSKLEMVHFVGGG